MGCKRKSSTYKAKFQCLYISSLYFCCFFIACTMFSLLLTEHKDPGYIVTITARKLQISVTVQHVPRNPLTTTFSSCSWTGCCPWDAFSDCCFRGGADPNSPSLREAQWITCKICLRLIRSFVLTQRKSPIAILAWCRLSCLILSLMKPRVRYRPPQGTG